MKPEVSIVMPVYNGEKYLKEAIESLLNQTFHNFELIIINDGSTDKSEEIAKSYHDDRIVYISNSVNLGLSKSFNIGVRAARGEYIARMDADDVSIPERLSTQVLFLANNPEIGIVGSAALLIDQDGRKIAKLQRVQNHLEIKWMSLTSTPLIHPSVMARSRVLKENPYDESLTNSEDYELWSRLLFTTNTKFANLPKPLLYYRVYKGSFTQTVAKDKRAISAYNSIRNLEHYRKLTEEEKELIVRIRQEESLSLPQLFKVWNLYRLAMKVFLQVEKPTPSASLFYPKLLSLAFYLTKYGVRH